MAATPETVKKLAAGGRHSVIVQAGAGEGPAFRTASSRRPGRRIVASAADVYASRHRPEGSPAEPTELPLLRRGSLLIGLLVAARGRGRRWPATGVTAFAMELLPRISRAQTMDVLSSQANIAGYKAVLSRPTSTAASCRC